MKLSTKDEILVTASMLVSKKVNKNPVHTSLRRDRICSSCATRAEDGEYIQYNAGKNQRWICKSCSIKRKERIAAVLKKS